MTLVEALGALRVPERRNTAGHVLLQELSRLARATLREPRCGLRVQVPEDRRDDVVQRTCLKLIELGGLPRIEPKGEGACRSYLATMLVRFHLSSLRRREDLGRSEDVASADAGEASLSATDAEAPSADAFFERVRLILEPFVAKVRTERQERHRDALDLSWQQIKETALAGVPIERILARDEGVDEGSSEAEREDARGRLYTNHSRTRKAIADVIDGMTGAGELSADQAKIARAALQLLFRVSGAKPRGVSKGRE